MVRLADFLKPGEKPAGREELRALLAALRALEAELRERFDVPLVAGMPGGIAEYIEFMVPQITSWRTGSRLITHLIQPVELGGRVPATLRRA
jgi:hypothetical protein